VPAGGERRRTLVQGVETTRRRLTVTVR
jgi:hypothetical protein